MYKNQEMNNKDIVQFKMPLLGKSPREESTLGTDELSMKQKLEVIEREAYEKGFEAGEKAGFSIGEQKVSILIEKLESMLKEIHSLKEQILKELEPEILELALSIARKILIKELKTNPEEIIEMTKEALKKLTRTGQIIIKINPSLYNLFMKHKPEIYEIHQDIVFDTDPSVSHSTIIAPKEEIVTDIDEQLKNLIRDIGYKLVKD
ncbi:MAG: FliH/SctL family protein [Thermodesulfovibrionales bacterium]